MGVNCWTETNKRKTNNGRSYLLLFDQAVGLVDPPTVMMLSYLPLPLTSVSLEVSLAFTAAAVAASPKKDSVGDRRSGGGGKGARGVQRSPSAVSSSNNSVIRYQ